MNLIFCVRSHGAETDQYYVGMLPQMIANASICKHSSHVCGVGILNGSWSNSNMFFPSPPTLIFWVMHNRRCPNNTRYCTIAIGSRLQVSVTEVACNCVCFPKEFFFFSCFVWPLNQSCLPNKGIGAKESLVYWNEMKWSDVWGAGEGSLRSFKLCWWIHFHKTSQVKTAKTPSFCS